MSNKPFESLNSIDKIFRLFFPAEMTATSKVTQVTVEKICGFELFNTRPYHNYETWSDGWRVSKDDVVVEAEDLDDAVNEFTRKYKEKHP